NADGLDGLVEIFVCITGFPGVARIQEKGQVRCPDMDRCVRKNRLAVTHQTAGMVSMYMSNENVGHVFGLHANAGQAVISLSAVTRPEKLARAGIDQNSTLPVLDQECIDGCFYRVGNKTLAEQAVDMGM